MIVAQARVDRQNPDRVDRAAGRLMARATAQDAIEAATSADPLYQTRQYGVVTMAPKAASFTGSETFAWSGAATGQTVSVQGNILVGPEVVDAALGKFLEAMKQPEAALSDALVSALEAGDQRCPREQAALSAFVAVARTSDQGDFLSLWLAVPGQRFGGQNPVTLLRQEYDEGNFSPSNITGVKSDGLHPAWWGFTVLVIPMAGIAYWGVRRMRRRRSP